MFIEDDQRAIKGVPVSSSNQPDKLVWRGTKNGVFLVSSAYHMVKEMEIETQPESSTKRGQNELWKGIWNMRSPNVVKNFMWRACKNILPTKENLMKKKIIEESLCPICMLKVETTFHALWDCLASRDVWGASLRIFQKKFSIWLRLQSSSGYFFGEMRHGNLSNVLRNCTKNMAEKKWLDFLGAIFSSEQYNPRC
jgi:hypothetical protein